MTSEELKLPAELVAFLQAGKELQYDPDDCDTGLVTLLPFEALKLQYFPCDYGHGLVDSEEDPHLDDSGCYTVTGVNLIATCEEYDPEGLLLWLPLEQRFAAWDSDHRHMEVFAKSVTWASIVADPGPHLEASCGGEGNDPPFDRLKPWLAHPFTTEGFEGLRDIDPA